MKMLGRALALDNAISEDFNRLIVMCSRSMLIFHFAFLFYFILFLLFLTCHRALSGKLNVVGKAFHDPCRKLPKAYDLTPTSDWSEGLWDAHVLSLLSVV